MSDRKSGKAKSKPGVSYFFLFSSPIFLSDIFLFFLLIFLSHIFLSAETVIYFWRPMKLAQSEVCISRFNRRSYGRELRR